MGEDRIASHKNVTPSLDVPIPENLVVSHTIPGAAKKALELHDKRQVQPHDHVGASRNEVTDLTLAQAVDYPPGLSVEGCVNPDADLVDGRLGPMGLVLDRIYLDEDCVDTPR